MNAQPKISIVQCNYNHGRFLRQCFAGFLQQNYTNFELIITDDGSTDESRKIIEEHAARDHRIKPIFFSKNQGIQAAHHASLSKVTGDLLYSLACDDFVISPDFFKDAVDALQRNAQAALFYGVCGLYEAETNQLTASMGTAAHEGFNHPLECIRGFLQYRCIVTVPLYRTELYLKHGGGNTELLFRELGPLIDYYMNHNLAFRHGVVYRSKPYSCQRVFQKQTNYSARPNLWEYAARMGNMERHLREPGLNYPGIEHDWERWRAMNTADLINKSGILNTSPSP